MLDEWRAEVARKPLAMSEAQACKVLELQPAPDGGVSEDDLKAAYRSLARKCALPCTCLCDIPARAAAFAIPGYSLAMAALQC